MLVPVHIWSCRSSRSETLVHSPPSLPFLLSREESSLGSRRSSDARWPLSIQNSIYFNFFFFNYCSLFHNFMHLFKTYRSSDCIWHSHLIRPDSAKVGITLWGSAWFLLVLAICRYTGLCCTTLTPALIPPGVTVPSSSLPSPYIFPHRWSLWWHHFDTQQ